MKPDSGVVLRDVTVRYGRRLALEAVSGEFAPGSLTAVVGANGAGKSTLLMAIAGTIRPGRGSVSCPARARGRLAYLPQQTAIDRDFPVTVAELIALGAWRDYGAFRAPPVTLGARVRAAAATVDLEGHLKRRIDELSVGEFQRALFARLIMQDAEVILLDEPFAPVDAPTTAVLLDQILRWHGEGRTVIAVLHDLPLVRAHFPAALMLARRCLGWGATSVTLAELAA